jgi:hypothetical protein
MAFFFRACQDMEKELQSKAEAMAAQPEIQAEAEGKEGGPSTSKSSAAAARGGMPGWPREQCTDSQRRT